MSLRVDSLTLTDCNTDRLCQKIQIQYLENKDRTKFTKPWEGGGMGGKKTIQDKHVSS